MVKYVKIVPLNVLHAQILLDALPVELYSSVKINVHLPAKMDNMEILILRLANLVILHAQSALMELILHVHNALKVSYSKVQRANLVVLKVYISIMANACPAHKIARPAPMNQLV